MNAFFPLGIFIYFLDDVLLTIIIIIFTIFSATYSAQQRKNERIKSSCDLILIF